MDGVTPPTGAAMLPNRSRVWVRWYGASFQRLLPWIFTLVFFWLALATLPTPPQVFGTGLDASWAYGLNLAHAQNLVFGRDVVFTFGPLGYLLYPVPGLVASFPPWACAWAIHALFLFGAFLVWRSLGHRLIVFVSWAVLSGAVLLTGMPNERARLAFLSIALGIVASLGVRGQVSSGYLIVSGVAAGLMLLMKTNEGIAACVVFYSILAAGVLSIGNSPMQLRRRVLLVALVPPLTAIAGFVLVERNVSALWAYATRSLQVVLGYSEGMSQPGPLYQVVLGVFSLVAIGFVIPLLAVERRDLLKGLLPALTAGYFAFKSAAVRQDGAHATILQVNLAVAGLFVLVCVKNMRDRRLLLSYVGATFCFGAIVHLEAFPDQLLIGKRRALLLEMPAHLSDSWHWVSTWERLAAQTRQALEGLRVDAVVANLVRSGTVDDIPVGIDYVKANGWSWKPRPVIQSYSAYTPALDELNARHLASPAAADHIIMQWGNIDGKHPLLDDAASWRSLFDHYDVELMRPGLLVLKRRESSRYREPHPIGSTSSTWQSEIAIPDAGRSEFTIMRAEIGKSLYGYLRGILFRNSPTYVNATYRSGIHAQWRVTRANLANGALISYLPETLDKVMPYFGQPGEQEPDRVVSIRFETPGQAEFSSVIQISWYALAARPNEAGSTTAATVSSGTASKERLATKFSQLGAFRPSTPSSSGQGVFLLDANGNRKFDLPGDKQEQFGLPGDIPVAGDWDGTGIVRLGVYRPSNGHWYLDLNNNGKWDGAGRGLDLEVQFGTPSAACTPRTAAGLAACPYIPIVGDWTGTGVSKLGIFRGGQWFIDNKNPGDSGPHTAITTYNFGMPGDLPVAANWNGTGTADQIGVYRRGTWIVDSNGNGIYERTDSTYTFGSADDFPVTGNWNGTGVRRIGVMKALGQWYLDINGDHVFTLPFDLIANFGQAGDLPVVGGPWTTP